MKYIRLFNTVEERNAAVLERPYVVYTKDTDVLEMADEYPITSAKNAALMSVCYSQGWAADEAFMTEEECAAVTDAMLAATVTSEVVDEQTVYTSAFTNVTSFSELNYFKGLTTIPSYCFTGCTNLTKIVIPDNITTIASYAFNGCTGFNGKEVLLPSKLASLGGAAFNNVALYKIVLPPTCTSLGSNAFKSAKRIDMSGCLNFTTLPGLFANPVWVKIPKNVTKFTAASNIGTYGYNNTRGWLWLDSTIPFEGFYGFSIADQFPVRVYVPDDYVNIYKTSTTKINLYGTTWADKAQYIYPQSQWQTDLDGGYIVL